MELPGLFHLLILLGHIRTCVCQCSGTPLELDAFHDYTTFTSPNYPSIYGNNLNCEWRIEALNATDAVRKEITDTVIEYHANCVYDTGQVYDGFNTSATSMGTFCGKNTPNYVSSGVYMTVAFVSHYSLGKRGFKARYKSGPRDSLIDSDDSSQTTNMILILGSTVSGLVFFLVLMVICITYIQAKKAQQSRRRISRLRRGHSEQSRTQTFSNGIWAVYEGPAPPAYGEIYSSPISPPPAYCEADPNPDPSQPLPGRPQYMSDGRVNRQVIHVIQVHNAAGGTTTINTTVNNNTTEEAAPSLGRRNEQLNGPVLSARSVNATLNVPNAPTSQNPPISTIPPEAQASGNVAPLATQSMQRGTTRVNRPNQNTNAVTSNGTGGENQTANTGQTANQNVAERRRSESSISVVSLPESLGSVSINSQYSELSDVE